MALAIERGLSSKMVSERHYYASQSKYTAGEAAKILSRQLGRKISAKEMVKMYEVLEGREPEWHHSGFYKGANGSTMGRTFFFGGEDIQMLAENQEVIAHKIQEKKEAEVTIVRGFYYTWDHDYSGYRGKKRNFKRLAVYEGPESGKPKNFTSLDEGAFEKAKSMAGKAYYGWDEPKSYEFI